MKRILSQDGNRKEIFHFNEATGESFIQKQTDVSGILKANQFQRDHAPMRHTSEVMNHKARIPVDAIDQWCAQRGIKVSEFYANREMLTKFLNDPDNAVWLTRKGKV